MLWLWGILSVLVFCSEVQAAQSELTVYTYSSFTSKWGPGPKLTKMFEKDCHCTLKWVGSDDGVALLNRLRLEGQHSRADVVVGLDTNLMPEAKRLKLVQPHLLNTQMLHVPGPWHNRDFIPYDRGQFAFVYNENKLKNPPTSMHQLVEQFPGTIIYEDPRTSTPGLGLLLWVKAVYGDQAPSAWKKLKEKTVTVTKSWDDAYGMFLKGEADMVLSYTTDSAYHEIEEHNNHFKAAAFKEGNYQQIEVAAIGAYARHVKLARQFLAFLITPKAQRVIALNNWMLPVRNDVPLPKPFAQIVHPHPLMIAPAEVAAHRQAWVRQWRDAVSQ
ncbi:thiamine ABC transporter substrate binding subunit [Celerinatantimonas yamalensis]